MMNKDYILRIAERIGRELAIILGLRQRNKHEDALIYIDDLLFQSVGLTSGMLHSMSEEVLFKILSPFGTLNVDKCLWVISLVKTEGDIYSEQGKAKESYYCSLKALNLLLMLQIQERTSSQADLPNTVEELLPLLAEYELPVATTSKLFAYYELTGQYAKAEDVLFERLESVPHDATLRTEGQAFYQRLLAKSDGDLQGGNLCREEVWEGLTQLRQE